jgi:hypothetical protein
MRFPPLSWLAGDRRRQLIAGGGALVTVIAIAVALVAAGVFSGDGGGASEVAASPTPEVPRGPDGSPLPPTEPTLLDGVLVYPDELAEMQTRRPMAVMFDNLLEARPQVGIEKAEIVYEAVAEGGVTRLLACYWRNKPGKLVPVRSARVYYLDWAKELDALYVHWGAATTIGLADVPAAVARLGVDTFDGFYLEEPYFSREPRREGPHDGIADTDSLWALAAERGLTGPPDTNPWLFKDDEPGRAGAGLIAAPAVDVGFGGVLEGGDYIVRWTYDAERNGYLRNQGGAAFIDGGSREQSLAKNVAVAFTVISIAPGEVGEDEEIEGDERLVYDTVGSGEAVVFQDGVALRGTWSKPDPTARIRFYNEAGQEIAFNRGQTWVEVVSTTDPVVYGPPPPQ